MTRLKGLGEEGREVVLDESGTVEESEAELLGEGVERLMERHL